jgi:hypothetical protein
MVVWSGGGALIGLSLILLSFIFNMDSYLHDGSSSATKLNWWLPLLLNAPVTWYWSSFCEKMNTYQGDNAWLSNLFDSWGRKHTLFWIDIKYWAWIFLGLGLHLKFHT